MRYFDKVNKCCSDCKVWMDRASFDTHTLNECFMYQMDRIKREKDLEEWDKRREAKKIASSIN